MNPPRVFISYSHDSASHKEWVLKFATTLRHRGIDAILDQWDLKPGDDLPHFMETQLSSCDYALMICTEAYVEKANAGTGGVGYEKMIMTQRQLSHIEDRKVIPIIRQHGSQKVPTFMGSKKYIDFSKDVEIEYRLDDLMRTLLNAPLYEKPDIGANPFKPLEGSRPDRTADGIRSVMAAVAESYNSCRNGNNYYDSAVKASTLHRVSFDKYFEEAERLGLLERSRGFMIVITEKGREYLLDNGIVQP